MTESKWPHFSLEELDCNCGCGKALMNADFMDKLEKLRLHCGFPFIVTSAYRCADYDAKVGTSGRAGSGPHTTGHAMDIGVYGDRAIQLLSKAFGLGLFTGFGLVQKGDAKSRFIHIDDLTAAEAGAPRPNIWTY